MSIATGTFSITCSNCPERFSYKGTEAEFELVESHEREMGTENHYVFALDLTCECNNEISFEYHVWEYPIGQLNHVDVDIKGASIEPGLAFNFIT